MIRGLWSRGAVGALLAVSLLPVLAGMLFESGPAIVGRLAAAAAAVAVWQIAFRAALGVPYSWAGAVTVVAVALLSPTDTALWQVLLAVSFGVVIGELIFGGWGRNFLNAGAVALGFLYLSVPNALPDDSGTLVALGSALAGVTLLATGVLNWTVIAAAAGAFALASAGLGSLDAAMPAIGTWAFALVFLAADPVAAAVTRPGRWVYGAAAGGLGALLATGAPTAAHAAVFAVLLAAIFAPLIDQGAIAFDAMRRSQRHG